jgi:molybdate transport system substrate-binding protein
MLISALVLLVGTGLGSAEITVAAASSLTDGLTQVAHQFESNHPGVKVLVTFGSSGVLRRQIEQGSPVDVFISASDLEMDDLQQRGLIRPATRAVIATNRLVLIEPVGGRLKDWADLASPRVARVAIANPETVPCGRYTRETLKKRGLWSRVAAKAVFGNTARQALRYVVAGNVDAGIVFASDTVGQHRIRTVAVARNGTDHQAIRYPAAVTSSSKQARASTALIGFLKGPTGQKTLRRFGFLAPR